jgi:hypothetical protein
VTALAVNGDIGRRDRLGLGRSLGQALRRERAHLLRRGGLVGAEALILLARTEGLEDVEIRNLVASWEGRRWPRR